MKDNILVTAKISHLFLTFVLSSVILMVLVGIQSMVDGVFLGNYESSNAMASISCNYGAGKGERVARTLHIALTINFLLGISVLCLLHFHSGSLINIFVSNNGKIKELAIQGANIYAVGFLFNGYNIVMSGYHTSIGNALVSALIAAGRGIIFIAAGIVLMQNFQAAHFF